MSADEQTLTVDNAMTAVRNAERLLDADPSSVEAQNALARTRLAALDVFAGDIIETNSRLVTG